MNRDDLTIIAPAYYKSMYNVRYLSMSAAELGIDVDFYGIGYPYTDWIQTHITDCIDKLKDIDTSHVLFTDASDTIFLRTKYEIIDRYMRLGHPPLLLSNEPDGINGGGWMGETKVALSVLNYLSTLTWIPKSGDPQERWRFAADAVQFKYWPDYTNLIFSVNEYPTDACILHCAGGYTDPVEGKAAIMEPIWKQLWNTDSK